jgi:hypothetical protein
LALIVVIVLVVVGLIALRRPSTDMPKPASGPPQMSAVLRDFLYTPYTTLNIAATDIHDFSRFEMKFGSFGSKGLKYVVEPEVRGQIQVSGHNITWASVLDDFCQKNGCQWNTPDPNTIRISRAEAPK